MDSGLRYGQHIARTAKRGLEAARALKMLRGLRPETTRQLFTATVAPVVDYASAVWYPMLPESRLHLLQAAQRIAAQAVICSFKTVSSAIAEAEASILPIRQRLHKQVLKMWIDLHTLPSNHPLRKLRVELRKRFASPLGTIANWFESIDLHGLETIEPFGIAPWRPRPSVVLNEKKEAESYAAQHHAATITAFAHASAKGETIGLGIAVGDPILRASISLGERAMGTPHSAALLSIKEALHRAIGRASAQRLQSIQVFSCYYSALQSLLKPRQQSGQNIIRQVISLIDLARSMRISVTLRWIPFDAKVPSYQQARKLAKAAAERIAPQSDNTYLLKTAAMRETRKLGLKPKKDDFISSRAGKYTKDLDKALPGLHTILLYKGLVREHASILSQLRTSISRLNSYLAKIGASESSTCLCGTAEETVQHFLFVCPRWKIERSNILRHITTTRWGDTSFFLGGWSGQRLDGERGKWSPNLEAVKATIKFAKATTRLSPEEDFYELLGNSLDTSSQITIPN